MKVKVSEVKFLSSVAEEVFESHSKRTVKLCNYTFSANKHVLDTFVVGGLNVWVSGRISFRWHIPETRAGKF